MLTAVGFEGHNLGVVVRRERGGTSAQVAAGPANADDKFSLILCNTGAGIGKYGMLREYVVPPTTGPGPDGEKDVFDKIAAALWSVRWSHSGEPGDKLPKGPKAMHARIVKQLGYSDEDEAQRAVTVLEPIKSAQFGGTCVASGYILALKFVFQQAMRDVFQDRGSGARPASANMDPSADKLFSLFRKSLVERARRQLLHQMLLNHLSFPGAARGDEKSYQLA